MKNAADKTQVESAKFKEKRTRETELNDIRFVLSERSGRRFVWRYLEEAGIFRTSFTGNSETFFREGGRNLGLKLLADINEAQPDAYVQMVRESKEDKEKNNG